MQRYQWIFAFFVLSSLIAGTFLFDDSKEPPYFSRLTASQFSRNIYRGEDLSYALRTCAEGAAILKGSIWSSEYFFREAHKMSDMEIIRTYGNTVLSKGGKVLFQGVNQNGKRMITAKLIDKDKPVWIEVLAWNNGSNYQVTVIENAAVIQEIEDKKESKG